MTVFIGTPRVTGFGEEDAGPDSEACAQAKQNAANAADELEADTWKYRYLKQKLEEAQAQSRGGPAASAGLCLAEAGLNPIGWAACGVTFVKDEIGIGGDIERLQEDVSHQEKLLEAARTVHESYVLDQRLFCRCYGCGCRGGSGVRNPDTGKCEGTRPCNKE